VWGVGWANWEDRSLGGGMGALRRIDRLLAKTAECKTQNEGRSGNEGRSWHLTLGSGSSGGQRGRRGSDMTLRHWRGQPLIESGQSCRL
jgi:hypothetical protein